MERRYAYSYTLLCTPEKVLGLKTKIAALSYEVENISNGLIARTSMDRIGAPSLLTGWEHHVAVWPNVVSVEIPYVQIPNAQYQYDKSRGKYLNTELLIKLPGFCVNSFFDAEAATAKLSINFDPKERYQIVAHLDMLTRAILQVDSCQRLLLECMGLEGQASIKLFCTLGGGLGKQSLLHYE